MRAYIKIVVMALLPASVFGQQSREELATESFEVLMTRQELLFEIVKVKGGSEEYTEQVWLPVVAMMQSWPDAPAGLKDSYRWCQYALNNFLLFSSDYFRNEGQLTNSNDLTFNEYLSSRQQCEKSILAPQ